MYIFASQLTGRAILSMQTGTMIAKVQDLVINPDKLELIAFKCFAPEEDLVDPILATTDIRQIAADCILVDSSEALASAEDIVRLKQLFSLGFQLIGCKVFTDSGAYLGKINDYNINLETSLIQRLHIYPQLFKRFFTDTFIIEREQIIDVKPGRITVRDATVPISETKSVGSPVPSE